MTRPTATLRDPKPALTPKLRFPEFRDGPAWEEKILGNEGEFFSSLTGKAGADFDTGEARFVTYMNVFSNTFVDPKALRFVDVKEGESQNAVVRGDVFFTISSETPEEVGMSSVLLEELDNCYLNSFCALFRFSDSKRPNPVFCGYLLRQPLVRAYFTKKAQGSTRFNLSKDAFRSLPFLVPSPAEQQEIAECLSTLDELIGAESQKLDSLKAHKKGLMQQLFPREGETLPRLRFPKFQDTGDWAMKKLNQLVEFQSGGTPSKANPAFWNGSVPWVSAKDMKQMFLEDAEDHISAAAVDEGAKLVSSGTLLMLVRGMTLLKDVPICVVRREMSFNQDVKALRPAHGVNGLFLAWLLTSAKDRLLDMVTVAGHGTGKLDTDELKAMELMLPKLAEQHRIATCLSSLDDLITAQSDRLAALQTHKQSLLQQLFPPPTEADV